MLRIFTQYYKRMFAGLKTITKEALSGQGHLATTILVLLTTLTITLLCEQRVAQQELMGQ